MTWFLLLLLGIACVGGMVLTLRRKAGIYQYPFLASAVFAGFVFVQLVGLSHDSFLPRGALDKTIFMALLCLLMIHAGNHVGKKEFRALGWQFSQRRLLIGAAVLSLIGAFFFFQISRLPVEMTSAAQWSGKAVAYLFFASMMTYGLAIAALVYAKNFSKYALVIIIFDLAFYVDRIFIGARRGDAVELIVIFVLAFWFSRRWVVPRTAALAAIALGTLFLHSTGDYRSGAKDKPLLESVSSIDFKGNLKQIWEEGGLELRNAVYEIESADRFSGYDFGAFHWNSLVFNYVPAQIFGKAFKESLMIETQDTAYEEFGHVAWTGTTQTGITDSFRSFWYLGALKFFVIAYVISRIYKSAIGGNAVMQLFYMLMLVKALHAITHHTNWFVSPWIHMSVFLLPVFLFARLGNSGKKLAFYKRDAIRRSNDMTSKNV